MRRAVVVCWLLLAARLVCAQAAEKLTIESIFAAGGLTGQGPETVQWSPNGAKVSFVQRNDLGDHGALYYFDVATGKRGVLVAADKLANLAPPVSAIQNERQREWVLRYSVAGYQWAPDSQHLLFDSMGQLWVYSLESGTAIQVTSSVDATSDPKFSPDASRLSYVRNHNLYVRSIASGNEKALTSDKDENILNGEVDWLYAEELSVRSNYFWSPDGRQIVFLQTDERPVPTYPIVDWIPLHPKVEEEKYPKAGDPNPEVRVGVIGSEGGKLRWIDVGERQDREYIPRLGWVRPGLIYIELLNRAQNKLESGLPRRAAAMFAKCLRKMNPKPGCRSTARLKCGC